MIYIFFITSILGLLRDYSKTKQIILCKFIRSPIITYIIYKLLNIIYINNHNYNICKAIIFERWIMLIYKTILSFIKNDYEIKKSKYKLKYEFSSSNY